MACSKCNTQNTACGCKDAPYTTMPSYTCPPDEQCPVPNPCSEYVDTRCTYYNGAGIWEMGIEDGRSLQSIIQQMVIRTGADPECADPCSTCQATWNVFPVSVTSTTINVAWDPSATANTYQVEYQILPVDPCDLGSWTLLASQTTTSANIGSLTANSFYLIRVNSICTSGNCYSVTIKVKTEA
jgi:hypothetical protein